LVCEVALDVVDELVPLLGRAHPVELRRSVDVLNLLDRDARFERFEGLVVERLDSPSIR